MNRPLPILVLAAAALLAAGVTLSHDAEEPRAFAYSTGDGQNLFTTWSSGPRLGVGVEEETEHPEGGARVNYVVDGSAADAAGIRKGDIIVAIDGEPVRGPAGLSKRLKDREEDEEVTVAVIRDGKRQRLSATLTAPRAPRALIAPRVGSGASFFLGGRPKLGVQLVELTPELREHLGGDETGVLVSKVLPGTPAEHGGIEVGDLIVAVDGREIETAGDLQRAVARVDGEEIDVEVIRDGRATTLRVAFPESDDRFPSGPRASLGGVLPRVAPAPAHPAPPASPAPAAFASPPSPPAPAAPPAPPAAPRGRIVLEY